MRTNASDALILAGGHLIETADSLDEFKARFFIIASAWNMAIENKADSDKLLKEFLEERKTDAPEEHSIDELEFEMRRVMREKRNAYPGLVKKIIAIDASERAENDYLIRASFEPE